MGIADRGGLFRGRRLDSLAVEHGGRRPCSSGRHRPPANPICWATGSSRPARETGAQAIHPGFGFLSENAGVRAALRRGPVIVFIGPNPWGHRRHGRQDPVEDLRRPRRTSPSCRATSARSTIRGPRHPDRRTDRLSSDDQGVGRRRRQGDSRRLEPQATSRRASPLFAAKPRARSATTGSSSKSSSRIPRHIEIQVLGDKHGHVRAPVRTRMLDPTAQPESHRGGALAVCWTRPPAPRWARRPSRWPRRSATTPRARWSSSPVRTSRFISWK